MNGYYFTTEVRQALAHAREEAVVLRHEYVGTEHLLLGILSGEKTIATETFGQAGISPTAVRDKIISIVKKGAASEPLNRELPYTSRAKKVLELAMHEARSTTESYVGIDHLLLGIIAEGKGIAAQVLTDSGLTLERARDIIGLLRDEQALVRPREREGALEPAPIGRPSQIMLSLRYGNGATEVMRFSTTGEAISFLQARDQGGEATAR